MISWYEFIANALRAKGVNYRYGAKMEILGTKRQELLIKMYPKYYSGSRKQKALETAGKLATDCSGLVTWAAGTAPLSSSAIADDAIENIPIDKVTEKHIGWAVWKPGHIGIYIGNGKCIEARGFDYGVSIWTLKNRDFTHVLKLDFVDYDAFPQEKGTDPINVFMQALANKAGAKIEVDGITGVKTKAAVERFLLK